MRKCNFAFVFSFVVFCCGMAMAQESSGLTAKDPIKLTQVEGRMDHMSIDVEGQRLFATAFDNHTLEVIDLKTNRQIYTISNLDKPQGAYYDASTNRLFVACGGDGTVKIFDGTHLRYCKRSRLISMPTTSATMYEANTSSSVLAERSSWRAK